VLACALPFLVSNFRVFQFTMVLVYAIVLLGLNMLTGYNGQISLGHGAFYAIGAYTAAILMDRFGAPYWLTVPVAALRVPRRGLSLRPAGAAAREGLPRACDLRLGVALPQILKSKGLEHWTGGVQGIVITKPDAPFGIPLSADQWLYFFTLAVTVLMFVLAVNLLRGRIGLAMVAIRDHPLAASAMGIDIAMYKSLTFGVSAMYTGVGGALGAIAVQFVAPDSFTAFLLDRVPRRHRRRRARHHRGRDLRRHLHPVRPERRRPDIEGGAVGDLWHCSHRFHVPDAGRRIRRHPPSPEEKNV
jgi:branched-chain amino acid transport system permease protein